MMHFAVLGFTVWQDFAEGERCAAGTTELFV